MKRSAALVAFSREHQPALVLTQRIARANPAQMNELCASLPSLFARELEPHFAREEVELLPQLLQLGHGNLVGRTLDEHRQLRALVADASVGNTQALTAFGVALHDHVRFEERELFAIAEACLAPDWLMSALELPAEDMPAFYASAPTITLRDPLAELLGAARGGLMTYRYADAVRLAGHSCPTVASAYCLTRRALGALYGSALPERGALSVNISGDAAAGVNGVTASIVSLLTGAAGIGGFKGLGGRFDRRDLLRFGQAQPTELRIVRRDSGASVDARTNLTSVPADPRTGQLLAELLNGATDPALAAEFSTLWQARVRRILLDHADDPEVFIVELTS